MTGHEWWWSWLLTLPGLFALWQISNRVRWAWLVVVASEGPWVVYAILTAPSAGLGERLAAERLALTGKRPLAYAQAVEEAVFRALADATRRTILDELAERDGQTLFEICGRLVTKHGLTSSRQAISQHLAVLEGAGLVEIRRAGRYRFHYIHTEPLEPIRDRWLAKASRSLAASSNSRAEAARRKDTQ